MEMKKGTYNCERVFRLPKGVEKGRRQQGKWTKMHH